MTQVRARRSLQSLAALTAALVVIAFAVAADEPNVAAGEAQLRQALQLVDADASAFIIVPNLKRANDEITACLEGMDRANLLMGSRPIDQAKSFLGLNVAVDDQGSLLVVSFERPQSQTTTAWLIPVTDAGQFVQTNFKPSELEGQYIAADGRKMFLRPLDRHVIISGEEEAVRAYAPDPAMAERIPTMARQRGRQIAQQGEAMIYARQGGLRRFGERVLPLVQDAGECTVMSLDFDPLGVVLRGYSPFDPNSELGGKLAGGPRRNVNLDKLPAKPPLFYFAAAIDIHGLGGPEALRAFSGLLNWPAPPQWMTLADSLQFAAYPSPAGLQGGVLNDAVLVMQTDKPEDLRAALKDSMLKSAGNRNGVERTVQWTDNKQLKSGASADAYEVAVNSGGPDAAVMTIAQTLLVGNAGWRGFVKPTEDALVMTFSQRPVVLAEALAAANGEGERLDDRPVIRALRQWLPPQRDVELYFGAGPLAELATQLSAMFGAGDMFRGVGDFSRLDPVAMGIEVQDHAIESSLFVPSSVLAFALDAGMRMQMQDGPPVRAPNDAGEAPSANAPEAAMEPRP